MANPYLNSFQAQQQHFISSVRQTSIVERKAKLKSILKWIRKNEAEILEAVYNDFRKPPELAMVSEIKPIVQEIKKSLVYIRDWERPIKVKAPLYLLGSRSKILKEPKGDCLIIAPWNFPFNLAIAPLVSAISAGNCVTLKPSEHSSNTEQLIVKMISELFPREEVQVVTGGVDETTELLKLNWDHIFFTGSPQVGKIVQRAAADNLTSVTLELGGTNPVIIDKSVNIKDAARKLAWGKTLNAGQSCVAPNHILIDPSIKSDFIKELAMAFDRQLGPPESINENPSYQAIINTNHFNRIKAQMDNALKEGAVITYGGQTFKDERIIAPTILDNVSPEMQIYSEEIFGPVISIVEYSSLDHALELINQGENPLAVYLFTKSRSVQKRVCKETSSGAFVVNDTTMQFIHPNLPFGGKNNSGMGRSHGLEGFNSFSNQKAYFKHPRNITIPRIIFPPYTGLKRWIIKFAVWRL